MDFPRPSHRPVNWPGCSPTPLLRAWILGTQEVDWISLVPPAYPKTPTVGRVSGREGAPTWGTGAQLECLRGDGLYPRVGCPLSLPLQPIVCPVPAVEVQSPEPRPWWPSPGQRRAQRGPSQCRIQCSPFAAAVSDGCRGQGRAWRPLGSQGCYPHGGDRRDQWWLLSLARAQYRGTGPHPVHLALCVLVSVALAGTWPAPNSALMG